MSELKVGGKADADKVNVLETRTVKEKHGIFFYWDNGRDTFRTRSLPSKVPSY